MLSVRVDFYLVQTFMAPAGRSGCVTELSPGGAVNPLAGLGQGPGKSHERHLRPV